MQNGLLAHPHTQNATDRRLRASGDDSYRRLAATQMRAIAGFERCDLLVLDDLVRRGTLERYSRDTLICRQGDESDGLILVVDGVVAIGTWLGQRDAHVVGFRGAGQLHAILSALDGQLQELDLAAHEACILLRFPSALIREALQRDPGIREALTRLLAHRTRVMYDKLREATTLSVAQQLACELDALARAYGAARPQGLVIQLRLSQESLAQLLGASRQQVNSALQGLRAMGLLRIGREQITILDAAALEAQARSTRPDTQASRRLQREAAAVT